MIERISKDSVLRERRKLKKLRKFLDEGKVSFEDVRNSYASWRGGVSIMTHIPYSKTWISSLMSFSFIHLLKEEKAMSRNEIEQKIRDLKTRLSCQESDIGDWKVAKCMEYSTLGLEAPYDFQELHEKRQAVRNEIDALEAELKIAPISEEEIA